MSDEVWYCPLCQRRGSDPGVSFCRHDGGRVLPLSERGAQWIGRVLDEKYRVVSFIDSGGMAEVYAAERVGSGKRVAIKLLHASLSANVDAMARFRDEAELVALIAHPNVVAIEDFGTLPGAVHYMVMELLEGESLADVMDRGELVLPDALRYAMQACEGLAAAHERAVIHCDLKPTNFFLQRAGDGGPPVLKILDLGIGRLLADSRRTATSIGMVTGTPDYMSPEQAMGHELGPASDIYSMGVVLYELLLGYLPFVHAEYSKVLAMHLREAPKWSDEVARARGVPMLAREVVMRAMAKAPPERQQSMLELQDGIAAVARVLRGQPAPATSARDAIPRDAPTLPDAQPRASSERPAPPARPASAPANQPRAPRTAMERVALSMATGADTEVVELARDVYWVGRRVGAALECNAYLRVFRKGDLEVSILVDPGPPQDFGVIRAKVAKVIGSLARLDFVFLNHQDPDVSMNAAAIQQASPRTQVLCSIDTWRLARFYGLDAKRFTAIDGLPGGRTTLATGHELVFVATPFCHFRGAVALFDPESRVLFSGDLFGGAQAPSLVADDQSWPGVKMFHQIYMPSTQALKLAAARVARLSPKPAIIAPQHGAMVVGSHIERLVADVAALDVGLGIGDASEDLSQFVSAANDILAELTAVAGVERVKDLLASSGGDGSFTSLFVTDGPTTVTGFKVAPQLALDSLVADALAALAPAQRGELQRSIALVWREHQLDGVGKVPGVRLSKPGPHGAR